MRIGVIGGGAWGTALAQVAAGHGDDVLLWAREAEVVEAINGAHHNPLFLPNVTLAPAIRATSELAAMAGADALLLVTPAQHLRSILGELPQMAVPLVLCAKGIEAGSQKLMSEVAAEAQPGAPIAVLSGPTFAHEVAAGLPTAVTLACADEVVGAALCQRLARATFRPYASSDVIGAEIGGAVKNVLAIACGVVDGMKLGLNARAALISRGFAEMTRFGEALGAQAATFAGLTGLGDLVLTATGELSRNRQVGLAIGQGQALEALLASGLTAEGARCARAVRERARRLKVEMPITEAVCHVLFEGVKPIDAVTRLLSRVATTE